ncbi:MAG: hypothetical protein AB9866_19800 [Syntrophobacteraceae bacterium]
MPDKILLDLNNPVFQEDLLSLEKDSAVRILSALRKIRKLTWPDVYRDKGLRWETVQSKSGPGGSRLYTIRIARGFRALVCREGQFMRFLSLNADHDSVYK